MGLDLELLREDSAFHASWSYTGFSDFRRRLAAAIGVDLDAMVGFGGQREWSEVTDPIVPLLNHSDCDGELGWSDCDAVLPRLRELIAGWEENDYDRVQAERLCEMMNEVVNDDARMVYFS